MVRMLASGTPWEAEISNPEAQTPSKPASSTSFAERPVWAPAMRTGLGAREALPQELADHGSSQGTAGSPRRGVSISPVPDDGGRAGESGPGTARAN